MLAGHEALLHIPNFQVVQRKHVFLFFLLLYRDERERADFSKAPSRQQHTSQIDYHSITLDCITLTPSNATFTPATREYKLSETGGFSDSQHMG